MIGPAPLPATAEVAIIGGGIMGTSIAFHLAEAGVRNVVLLERDTLGSGSSAKPLGGVRATFSDPGNIALGLRSLSAYEVFGERFGTDIALRQVGYLFLCRTEAELAAVETSVAVQNSLGCSSRTVTPAEAYALNPLVDPDCLLGASFSPRDGFTARPERPHPTVPFTLDLSTTMYFHNYGDAMLLGISNRDEEPGFCREFDHSWTRAFDDAARVIAPSLAGQDLVGGWAGLYENTPDHNALIGRADVPGVYYATGFSGHGFLQGPAVGEIIRDLYLDREPFLDATPFSADRFDPNLVAAGGGVLTEVHII